MTKQRVFDIFWRDEARSAKKYYPGQEFLLRASKFEIRSSEDTLSIREFGEVYADVISTALNEALFIESVLSELAGKLSYCKGSINDILSRKEREKLLRMTMDSGHQSQVLFDFIRLNINAGTLAASILKSVLLNEWLMYSSDHRNELVEDRRKSRATLRGFTSAAAALGAFVGLFVGGISYAISRDLNILIYSSLSAGIPIAIIFAAVVYFAVKHQQKSFFNISNKFGSLYKLISEDPANRSWENIQHSARLAKGKGIVLPDVFLTQ